MFADASSFMIYITTNEGDTFTMYTIPVDPKRLQIHPTMPGWLLGITFKVQLQILT